jgi:hypothetical protein
MFNILNAATEKEDTVADITDDLKCDEECAEAKSVEIDWDNFDVEDPSSFLEKSGLDKVNAHFFLS